MDDKVAPIRPGVVTQDSSTDMVLEDLKDFSRHVTEGGYQPRFGVVVFLDQSGRVCTHSLGEMKSYELIGILSVASQLYVKDASGG